MASRTIRLAPQVSDFTMPNGEIMKYPKTVKCAPGEYSRRGLLALYERGLAKLTQGAGVELPPNAGTYGAPGVGLSRKPRHDEHGWLEQAARVSGWLTSVGKEPQKYSLLVRLLKNGIFSPLRGVNSPYNDCDPVRIAQANPSPGRLQHVLRHAIRRADIILEAYGLRTSWASIVEAAHNKCQRVGKIAHFLVRKTLKQFAEHKKFGFWGKGTSPEALRGLKDWLASTDADQREIQRDLVCMGFAASLRDAEKMNMSRDELGLLRPWERTNLPLTDEVRKLAGELPPRQWFWLCMNLGGRSNRYASLQEALHDMPHVLVEDNTDGVNALLDMDTRRTESAEEYGRVTITEYLAEGGRRGLLVVSEGGRTYHADLWADAYATHHAVCAWRRQDEEKMAKEMAKEMEEVAQKGGTDKVSILVLFKHSILAGNCKEGTNAWIERHKLSRKILPVSTVWRLGDREQRARNAALVAVHEVIKLMTS